METQHKQIGEVADRIGLSLRTIRYYEEVGLVTPSARSHGGFRLYTEADIARLLLIKRMKPLGFSLDHMRELLELLDSLEDGELTDPARFVALERLAAIEREADDRCRSLREELAMAEEFAERLHAASTRLAGAPPRARPAATLT